MKMHLVIFLIMIILLLLLFSACSDNIYTGYRGQFLGQDPLGLELRSFISEIFSPQGKYKYHLHSSLSFSPDGKELYFTVQDMQDFHKTIIMMKQIKDHWTKSSVPQFSEAYSDEVGWFSPDGRRLYFFSNRPLKSGQPKAKAEGLWLVPRLM